MAICAAAVALGSGSFLGAATDGVTVEGRNLRVEFDRRMYSHLTARFGGREIELGPLTPSETAIIDGAEVREFTLSGSTHRSIHDELGAGTETTLTGRAGNVEKAVAITIYDGFPQMAFFQVRYTNRGTADMRVTGWSNNRYSISARAGDAEPAFWSYESGSYQRRPDWIVPLKVNFQQENYLGMNASDYGGGTPIVDVWRRDAGLAVGHLEMTAKLVSMLSGPAPMQAMPPWS